MPSIKDLKHFDSCGATASMFLYAQANSIVCCHHDTLTIDRRFARHSHEVQFLSIDNQSEAGAGRLVVSCDSNLTAIVWDLMTGDEIARFTSYVPLTVASWMRNGNVAFGKSLSDIASHSLLSKLKARADAIAGNTQGNIILFEPTTSEHISSRTIDQIGVTALAPSADCRTFAIGYVKPQLSPKDETNAYSVDIKTGRY